ncbi:MAG: YbaB/EbfC family nucleoid-associated protein [Myxococcota bacterium]
MDMNQLMEMAKQMRGQLAEAQGEAAQRNFEGEAGGGMVKVKITGRHEVLEVKIDPSVVDPKEIRLLEDLLRAAVNQALSKAESGLKEQLGGLAQGFGLDLSGLMNPGGSGHDGGNSQP